MTSFTPSTSEIRSMFISHTESGVDMLFLEQEPLPEDDRESLERIIAKLRSLIGMKVIQ